MQSGLVGVLGAIAAKLVATEPAFAEEHVFQKTSRHFSQPPFPVQENLNKQATVPSGNVQVRKLRFKYHLLPPFLYLLLMIHLFIYFVFKLQHISFHYYFCIDRAGFKCKRKI